MRKVNEINIGLDLSTMSVLDGFECMSNIIKNVDKKLSTNNNGEFYLSVYLGGKGEIGFTEINDIAKAEKWISEIIKNLNYSSFLLGGFSNIVDRDN